MQKEELKYKSRRQKTSRKHHSYQKVKLKLMLLRLKSPRHPKSRNHLPKRRKPQAAVVVQVVLKRDRFQQVKAKVA